MKNNYKHGHKKNRKSSYTYNTWASMIQRCTNVKSKDYKNYGGRGITVCNRWLNFSAFLEDMCEKPIGLTLDRIDNNNGYEKENCRWVSHKVQSKNTRRNIFYEHGGKRLTLKEWSEIINMDYTKLWLRVVRRKWPFVQAISISESLKSRHETKRRLIQDGL